MGGHLNTIQIRWHNKKRFFSCCMHRPRHSVESNILLTAAFTHFYVRLMCRCHRILPLYMYNEICLSLSIVMYVWLALGIRRMCVCVRVYFWSVTVLSLTKSCWHSLCAHIRNNAPRLWLYVHGQQYSVHAMAVWCALWRNGAVACLCVCLARLVAPIMSCPILPACLMCVDGNENAIANTTTFGMYYI